MNFLHFKVELKKREKEEKERDREMKKSNKIGEKKIKKIFHLFLFDNIYFSRSLLLLEREGKTLLVLLLVSL